VSATSILPPPADVKPSFLSRHQFLIYRLFSLSGLVPIGGYLVVHLLTNATVLDSPAKFQAQVNTIHSLGLVLPVVEWTFIFIPILFHAAVGWLIIAGSIPNNAAYRYVSNWRYTLQRATGIIAFFFILAHVIHLHHLGSALGGGEFDPHHAASSAGMAIQAALWIQIGYAIGVLAAAYHFGNGLWTQGITWGLWTTPAAQRRANYVTSFIGIAVAIVGLSSLVGMATVNVEKAYEVETNMYEFGRMQRGEIGSGDTSKQSSSTTDE
jgi:succinate dehydrogenase / fumarate reductase, cytochrome b subunit